VEGQLPQWNKMNQGIKKIILEYALIITFALMQFCLLSLFKSQLLLRNFATHAGDAGRPDYLNLISGIGSSKNQVLIIILLSWIIGSLIPFIAPLHRRSNLAIFLILGITFFFGALGLMTTSHV
jgi:hypothetical protein